MTDVTPQQGAELGTDALTLMVNLIRRNSAENTAVALNLYDSVQRDRDKARVAISRIRGNVSIVLSRPHADAMIADALYAGYDYEGDDAQ